MYDIFQVQVLDEILATLDLERLDKVLLRCYVQVDGDVLDVLGQVGRVNVLEHGFHNIRSKVVDDHAVR